AFSSTAAYTAKLKIGSDSDCLTIEVNSANGKVTFTGKASASKACTETLQLSTVKAAFGGKDLVTETDHKAEIDYAASSVKIDF
ncbi:hypothetical protein AVCANL279_09220, partial [Campylobacter canadensis]|uniref:hypothetical protein n=1 Tax=Campylobacter canadensis TaxID=449520 RepID=UPI001CCFD483